MRVARIAIGSVGVLWCLLVGPGAAGAAKLPMLMQFAKTKQPVANEALQLNVHGLYLVTSNLGTSDCVVSPLTATDTLNDNTINELTLGGVTSGDCGKYHTEAMPFGRGQLSGVKVALDTFPIGHSYGKIVAKQKGKSTTSGSAELVPSPSVTDSMSFAAQEGEVLRECRYAFSKKLKGTWIDRPEFALEYLFNDKWKLVSSDNEDACPKTVTVEVAFYVSGSSEFVELVVV